MGKEKSHRKPFKVGRQIGRGSYNPLILEGKSNVTAKRVTLLPGFLVSGFSSKTITKPSKNSSTKPPSAQSPVNTQRENILKGDLESFLRENNRKFRRSARILTKHLEQQNISPPSSCPESVNSDHCNKDILSATQNQENLQEPSVHKSILKTNSKSIFSQINERYSKKTDKCNKKVLRVILENNVNSTFCTKLKNDICVKFKSALLECQQKVLNEIECTNKSILGGSFEKTVSPVTNLQNMFDETSDENILFPQEQWVYETPHKQRILPFIEEVQEKTQLEPAVMYSLNQNVNNLYEFHPQFNLDPNQYFNTNEIDIDTRFLNKVGVIYKTPYKTYKTPEATTVGNEYLEFLQDKNDMSSADESLTLMDVEMNCRPCYSNKVPPNMVSTVLSQKLENLSSAGYGMPKANRKLNFDETYYMPLNLEQSQELPNDNFTEKNGDDVTFLLGHGGEFKMQESQKVKRQKTCFFPKFLPSFVADGNFANNDGLAEKNIFDFSNSQQTADAVMEKPMFDFSSYSK